VAPTIFAFDKEQTKYALQDYEGENGERRGTNSIREQLLIRIPPWSKLLTLTCRRMAFARLLDKYIHIFPAPVATANQSRSEDDGLVMSFFDVTSQSSVTLINCTSEPLFR